VTPEPWQTSLNSFREDPKLYPDLKGLVSNFHKMGIRVMMWITSVVNEDSDLFAEAVENNYLLKNGEVSSWWGGRGGLLDYDNKEALKWWHSQMDRILDCDIDGWKCDGSDHLILHIYKFNILRWERYKEQYYRDFFEYTRSRLGNDRVIMARPSDDFIGAGVAIPFAPVDVNFAGWVGDQDGDWEGLKTAWYQMLNSARLNYVNFGSDIGGFRNAGQKPEREKALFVRWTQLGAFLPVMENGGDGEHRPWKYDGEVLEIYRRFVKFHQALLPYFYSTGAQSFKDKISSMRPVYQGEGAPPPTSPAQLPFSELKKYRACMMGDAVFVAPILENRTEMEFTLPEGEWRYLLDEQKLYSGKVKKDFSLAEYPVFIKSGAILPLRMEENLFNLVLDSNPPPNVQQNIQAFLQLIEARRDAQSSTFSWTIASVLGSDGNINSATSNGLIDTPLIGEIELNPDGHGGAESAD